MNFLQLAHTRQSTRKYNPDKPVSRDSVERCIEAARLAPSACNSQPWEFIILDCEPRRREFAELAFGGAYKMNHFVLEAPVLIVVVRERSKLAARLGGMFRGVAFSLMDIGIASEHLCLQAAEEGLGTCMLGWLNEKQVKKYLRLPRTAKVDMIISMGYPADPVIRDKKRKDIKEIHRYIS